MMNSKEYIKPFIHKQVPGHMNKFGASYQKKCRSEIDNVKVSEIKKRFGSPVFVFSEKTIRKRYRSVYREFSSRYPRVQFSWSYKTNYLDAICSVFHQEGEIAEVVSEFEYQKARRLGVPGYKIIYNGPYKPEESLKTAFEEQAIVNLDGFDELLKAEKVAQEIGKPVKVGIRLNMDTGLHPQWTRFGFNLENGAAYEAAKRIHMSQWLNLNGLHSHIGTFILEPNAYAVQVQKMTEFMKRLENELDICLDYLDLGGGFPSRNKLKGTYLPPEITVPPVEEYIETICNTLLKHLAPGDYPTVYMETGRAMIDEAGYLITTVEGSRRLPDGTKSYIIDAGLNLLYTSTWYKYKVETEKEFNSTYENSVLYGPLCMNIDVVLENTPLPLLSCGDTLILSPMGAYNVTQWMQFIRYRPAVVMVMEDGIVEEIRRAENLDDIVALETVPEKLKYI
jgi:diaminopimelate decarboxylase